MAPSPRSPAPLRVGSRRPGSRSRRASVVVVLVTVLGLGGAVAAVYTTGVTLGTRIAPSDDAGAGPPASGSRDGDAAAGSSSSTEADADADDRSLPDRVEVAGSTSTRPGSTDADGGTGSADDSDPGADPVEPYPGLWPYVSWQEVLDHTARDDTRFRTPRDTALRFASEVVGLTGASVGQVLEEGVLATVEIRSGGGATLVSLTRATPGPSSPATPWSVVDATGGITLDIPTAVTGGALRATTDGRPGVVGVHDRTQWRGIGVAPTPGSAFDVRVDPGSTGPAMAIAVAGDPRAPSSFTVRRIQLAADSGQPAAAAPGDPLAATRALVDAVAAGDVGATWELLDPAARRSVLDWRGLAGRIPTLRDQLAMFTSGSFTATSVNTTAGSVSVVAPAATEGIDGSAQLAALAFRVDGGARLASTESASVDWTGPTADDPSVLASGSTRPITLVVDGAVWSSTPEGVTGLRASSAALPTGAHLAIAISVEAEQITAGAYLFLVTETPLSTPSTPEPPATPSTLSGADPAVPAVPAEGSDRAQASDSATAEG